MTNVDDLARLLVPPPGEDVIIRDATIRQWNPTTFENVIEYEGIRLRNVDVGAGAAIEALTYQPGDLVQLELRFAGGKKGELGIGDVAIRGRRITPGTGAAEKAVAFMQSSLAKSLSAQVFAERVHSSVSPDQAFFGASTGITPVPHPGTPARVTDVEVVTGKAIVIGSAIASIVRGDSDGVGGGIYLNVSGATNIPAGDPGTTLGVYATTGFAGQSDTTPSLTVVFDPAKGNGLNPGLHDFEVYYQTSIVSSTGSIAFILTGLTVIAF